MDRLKRLLLALLWVLYSLAIGWVVALIELIKDQQRRRERRRHLRDTGEVFTRCQVIPPDVFRRPDPLIYSQSYLMSLGLGVTWDNPDIALLDVAAGFTPVPSSALEADTEYEIRATIYNGSTTAPAVGMPVEFSFLSFGIGTTSTPIGATVVDLPVKGAPGHPATAAVRWRTPATPGHYCIQVKLVWADDANPANNLGQENTNVGSAHSPAVFDFPVRNENVVRQTLHLLPDTYTPPEPIDCDEFERGRKQHEQEHGHGRDRGRGHGRDKNGKGKGGDENGNEDWCRELRRRHALGNFTVEPGWNVQITPDHVDLGPGDSQNVHVIVDPPAGFTGTKAINVNAFDPANVLVGGVTLYVVR